MDTAKRDGWIVDGNFTGSHGGAGGRALASVLVAAKGENERGQKLVICRPAARVVPPRDHDLRNRVRTAVSMKVPTSVAELR